MTKKYLKTDFFNRKIIECCNDKQSLKSYIFYHRSKYFIKADLVFLEPIFDYLFGFELMNLIIKFSFNFVNIFFFELIMTKCKINFENCGLLLVVN